MSYHQHRARFEHEHLAVLDIETISGEEMLDGGFPPWCTHSPIVCSVLTVDRGPDGLWTFGLESMRFNEDEEPLERIDELLTGRSCVSYNGSGFDLPVLALTAQKMRCFDLPALKAAASEARYNGAKHFDVADRISGFGRARGASLERLCKELGIPAKTDVHGCEVGKLYDEGRVQEIVDYCEGDCAATLRLAAHRIAFEREDEDYFASLTSQFARWVLNDGREHLQPFAEVTDLNVLLAVSLTSQIDAARANAKADAEWQEQRRIDADFTDSTHY